MGVMTYNLGGPRITPARFTTFMMSIAGMGDLAPKLVALQEWKSTAHLERYKFAVNTVTRGA